MRKYIFLLPLMLLYFLSTGEVAAQRQMVVDGAAYHGLPDTINYYLPSSLPDTAKAPAVILLNGYGGSYRQWAGISNLQLLSNEYGMILICPDGFADSWYIDSPTNARGQYATFFSQSIIPAIKANIPVDTSLMFITGLSMGGHGAIHLMANTPGEFRAAGSMSGVMDLRASALSKTSLAKLLGPKTDSNLNWAIYSNIDNVDRIKQSGVPVIICCGSQDYLIEANRTFARKCSAIGVDIVYMESPGKHTREYWRMVLPEQLRFFRKFVNQSSYNK